MSAQCPRIAVRAILENDDRLLQVNAYAGGEHPLMCAPGGGVERGSSLPDNLRREVYEETGLQIIVGAPCLINEFHDPNGDFHCTCVGSFEIDPNWRGNSPIFNEAQP